MITKGKNDYNANQKFESNSIGYYSQFSPCLLPWNSKLFSSSTSNFKNPQVLYQNCLQHQYHFAGTCYADGVVECDKCAVDFLRGNAGRLFDCAPGQLYACQKKCRRLDCEDKCPTYSKAQAVCASDGNLYMDGCRAKCADPNLEVWFDCDCPLNKKKCAIKCKHMYDEKNCIPHHHVIKQKEVVFMHTPSVHLYQKMHHNSDKLDAINHKMNYNTMINMKQSKALYHQDKMLDHVLKNQSHDAMRDWKHMKAHKKAAYQRKDIMDKVVQNGHGIIANGEKAHALLAGQEELKDAHGYTQNQIKMVQGDVLKNQHMIGEVGAQVASHRVDFGEFKGEFDAHVAHAHEHDAKLDGLIAAQAHHDAKQDGLIAAQAEHDAKQDGLIAAHAYTQNMLGHHIEDHKAHDSRQEAFIADQSTFNNKIDAHMKAEKDHMYKEEQEMMKAAHHRAHENIHMAHSGHHHHHHSHSHSHPKYVEKIVPRKKHVLVIPHGVALEKKSYYVPEKRLVKTGNYHHAHAHGHGHGHGHGHHHHL